MSSDLKKAWFTKPKAIWIVVGLCMAMFLTLGVAWFLGQAGVNSKLAALRAEGLPTTAAELNAFYTVPKGVADTTKLWLDASDAVHIANLSTRGSKLPFVGEGPLPVPTPGEAWGELDASRKLLGELNVELDAVWRAAETNGQVRYPVDFSTGIDTLMPHLFRSRHVARLLQLDAHVSAYDGNCLRVLRDLKAIFAASEATRAEPTLISQLVRIAIYLIGCDTAQRLLPHCQWNDTELASLQAAVQAAQFKTDMSHALAGERAFCLSGMQGEFLGPLRPPNVHELLRSFDSSIDGFAGSWPETLKRQHELSTRVKSLAEGTFTRLKLFSALECLPALQSVAIAAARATARQRCTDAAIALQRYRLAHGRLPKSLADIEQKFRGHASEPSAQFTDPFDGQPLRYKMEPARVLVYSIGSNDQDDGGDCDQDPGKDPPLDIGFYLKK